MPILNIDTSASTASFCISDDEKIWIYDQSQSQKGQAAWLHNAIKDAFAKINFEPALLDAIAVSNGPGSYTGLRIGLATAKGLCYALGLPLICINTLEIMASAVKSQALDLICPMIDARRMEVFTALYYNNGEIYKKPFATVLTETSFMDELESHHVLFTGNGIEKFKPLIHNNNVSFSSHIIDARHMIHISGRYFEEEKFTDVAYSEPFYIKDVYFNNATA